MLTPIIYSSTGHLTPLLRRGAIEGYFMAYFKRQWERIYDRSNVRSNTSRRSVREFIDELEDHIKPPRRPILLSEFIPWDEFSRIKPRECRPARRRIVSNLTYGLPLLNAMPPRSWCGSQQKILAVILTRRLLQHKDPHLRAIHPLPPKPSLSTPIILPIRQSIKSGCGTGSISL